MQKILLIALLMLGTAWRTASPQTVQGLTSNNTSACVAGSSTSASPCTTTFAGMTDPRPGVNTPTFSPQPASTSTASVTPLLYPNRTTKVYAHLMGGFNACANPAFPTTPTGFDIFPKCNVELIYYTSNNQLSVQKQVADILRRGFDGVTVDWYAGATSQEGMAQHVSTELAAANPSARYALMYNGDTLVTGSNACVQGDAPSRKACYKARLQSDLCYMNGNHFGHANYLKFQPAGQTNGPVILWFVNETGVSQGGPLQASDWTEIWQYARSVADNLTTLCTIPGQNGNNGRPVFVFENLGGFVHDNAGASDGGFAWPQPGFGVANQSSTAPAQYLHDFYTGVVANNYTSTKMVWGAVYKGFNDVAAMWAPSTGRLIDQQLGLNSQTYPAGTWLSTWNEIGGHFSANSQLPFLLVATWNDYDEGHAIEMGIDNGLTGVSASVNGTTLSWTPSFQNGGIEASINAYIVYYSTGGVSVTPLGSVAPPTHSFDVSGLSAGTYTLYVYAQGVNSTKSQLSNGVGFDVGGGSPECTVTPDCMHGFYCQDFGCVPLPESYCPENVECMGGDMPVDYCRYPTDGCDVPYWENTYDSCCHQTFSPIVIDLSGEGFNLTTAEDGVPFDFLGNGVSTRMSWTAAGAKNAWLVLDRNGNGTIDSGKELFGNITEQSPSAAPNGFRALAEFDKLVNGGTGDGIIDARDAIFSRLRLWIDVNHNGISEPEELFTLESQGITAIDLNYQEKKWTDENGNRFRYRARVFGPAQGQSGNWAYDVFLVRDSGSGVPASFPPQ